MRDGQAGVEKAAHTRVAAHLGGVSERTGGQVTPDKWAR